MKLEHSDGKPGVFFPTTNINVRFVSDPPFQPQIKPAMKTLSPLKKGPTTLSLFQIAALIDTDTLLPAARTAVPPRQSLPSPFADLMVNPKKLEAALRIAQMENEAFETSRKFKQGNRGIIKKNSPDKSLARGTNGYAIGFSPERKPELKLARFYLNAPSAKSVQLAADFTEWEKFPLDMVRSQNGMWFTVIPLEPGHYAYRYIVDGKWFDEPRSRRRMTNPSGAEDNVVKIT